LSSVLITAVCASVLFSQSPLRAGDPAPRVELVALDGKRVNLASDGRVTIVDFFATWCGPCRASLASHEAILAAHGDRVRIVLVDVREPVSVVRAFFQAHPLPPGVVVTRDPTASVMSRFGSDIYPSFFVFDRAGLLRNRLRGWGANSGQTVLRWLSALMEPPAREPAEVTHDERARGLGVEMVR
jgi:thiol-disulfide isomerase/thioredoxin